MRWAASSGLLVPFPHRQLYLNKFTQSGSIGGFGGSKKKKKGTKTKF